MRNLCDVSFLLDRSGSMDTLKPAAVAAYNEFLVNQRAQAGDCVLSLFMFNEGYQVQYVARDINKVPNMNLADFIPNGWTSLLDAIGRTIDDVGKRLNGLPEDYRPNQVIIIIFTDGFENWSTLYSRQTIKEMIERQKSKYNWNFVFLGPGKESMVFAESIAIPVSNFWQYDATPSGTKHAMELISSNLCSYRASGESKVENFFEEIVK